MTLNQMDNRSMRLKEVLEVGDPAVFSDTLKGVKRLRRALRAAQRSLWLGALSELNLAFALLDNELMNNPSTHSYASEALAMCHELRAYVMRQAVAR